MECLKFLLMVDPEIARVPVERVPAAVAVVGGVKLVLKCRT
jgi:hypothetical protein